MIVDTKSDRSETTDDFMPPDPIFNLTDPVVRMVLIILTISVQYTKFGMRKGEPEEIKTNKADKK